MADDPFAAALEQRRARPSSAEDNPFAAALAERQDAAASKKKEPATSATDAFGRALTSSASFGFRDEGQGLIEAGGGGGANASPDALTNLGYLARGAYRKFTGDPEAERLYQAAVARERAQGKVFEQEHPEASLAGTVAGAVAVPIGFAARAPTWTAKALAAARTGAVAGGLAGLGEAEGDLGERLPAAVQGAGIGAAVGGVASPVISGLGAAAGRVFSPLIDKVKALRGYGPGEEARRFVDVVERGRAAGDVGLSGQEMSLAQARGQPVTALEQHGEPVRALARAAADASPEARSAMLAPLEQRFETQGPRMSEFLSHMTNHPNPVVQQEAIRAEGSLANKPLYDAAYAAGDRPIMSDELQRLLGADEVQGAMKGAVSQWRGRQIMDGYGNLKAPITINPRTQELEFTNSRGFPTEPNLQLWDYTARNLAGAAEKAKDRFGRPTEESSRLSYFANAVKDQLDQIVPQFKEARASAKTFRGHENAVDFGRDFFGASGKKDFQYDLRDFSKLNDAQKKIAADAYLGRFMEAARSTPDRNNIIGKIKTSHEFRTELNTMLGPQKAAQIEDWLRVEALMERSRQAVAGGSPTSRLLQQAKQYAVPIAVGQGSNFLSDEYSPTDPVGAFLSAITLVGQKRLNRQNANIMREVATRLVSGDPTEYNKAMQTITSMPAVRRIIHEASDAIMPSSATLGRVGGTIAGQQQGPP